jgi:hypothetical protein
MISTTFAQEGNNIDNTAKVAITTTNTSSISLSCRIQLSALPVWKEQATNTGVTPINKTHTKITFIGNGTLTLPNTGKTIVVTNNGTLIGSSVTQSAYGRETVITQDGQTSTITFYEIVQSNPMTNQEKAIIIAVFDKNATGTLAAFNGMILAGIYEVSPNSKEATVILWKWESGIGCALLVERRYKR